METTNSALTAKQKKAAYNKQYRETHKEQKKVYMKDYNSAHKDSKRQWCKNNPEYYKQYYINNPDKVRNKTLKYRYGITLDNYNRMFAEQNGCCKICNIHASELKVPLQVDHSHITGVVRGLLCGLCNSRLGENNIGRFNDTDILYSKALGYIIFYNN